MNKEARCRKCDRLLGKVEGLETFAILVQACQATSSDLRFDVQCPRCGQVNSITVKYNQ
jgi:phage FluMu protein Com